MKVKKLIEMLNDPVFIYSTLSIMLAVLIYFLYLLFYKQFQHLKEFEKPLNDKQVK